MSVHVRISDIYLHNANIRFRNKNCKCKQYRGKNESNIDGNSINQISPHYYKTCALKAFGRKLFLPAGVIIKRHAIEV